MRLQLLLSFMLIIAIVLLTGWAMAIRTTDARFAVLVSETNQQQARSLAPGFLNAYENSGSWAQVQTALVTEKNRQVQWRQAVEENLIQMDMSGEGVTLLNLAGLMPELMGENFEFNLSMIMSEEVLETWLEQRNNPSGLYYIPDATPHRRGQTLVVQPPGVSWLASNMILSQQRAIVTDTDHRVVLDTGEDLLGRRVDTSFASTGVPLYSPTGMIGTLVITSENGVYTFEQSAFLQEVKSGFLLSGLVSAGIALILALLLAYQITRPVRSLTAAAARIQAGEWGYQVKSVAQGEIEQLTRAFNEMSNHLAEQRRLRARLVDDLAHELNTPLSLIRLEVQGMADGFQTPAEAAQHLDQELSEVEELVSDLVFLASRDTAPTPQMDWLDLNLIVSTAVRRFEGSASQSRTLIFRPAENLPPLYGDAYLIQRAVSNLISNAIRHTPADGTITLKTQKNGDHLEVIVQDTGEGIPPEHLPHIFERFYRVDHSRARQSGGRGLGLAIVQQIMEQHQGRVLVESEVGKGSTFRLVWHLPDLHYNH